jgi:hypothetical protein
MAKAKQPSREMITAYELIPNYPSFSEQPASLLEGKKFVNGFFGVRSAFVHSVPLVISVVLTALYYNKPFWFEQTDSVSIGIPILPLQVNI